MWTGHYFHERDYDVVYVCVCKMCETMSGGRFVGVVRKYKIAVQFGPVVEFGLF